MRDLQKAARKAIRELATLAYERELSIELSILRGKFDEWQRDVIDAFALEQAIHAFHNGAARELFNRYSPGAMLDHAVAGAVIRGALQENELPEIAREHILRLVAVFRTL
jgi:hypothetical protein